ncbi:sulfatase-like hydrolase/transferase [Martelella sp. AMO21009]
MSDKPNIVFILSDQHNADVMGAAGHGLVRTPNLDRLRQSGCAFDNAYCSSPLCAPSRASLLAGVLPSRTGVFNNTQALRSDQATFVHALALAGYDTVLAGRMHFNGPDQRHGFERRLVGDITPSFPGRGRRDLQFGDLIKTPDQSRIAIDKSGGGNSAVLQFDRAVTDAACAYLDDRKDDKPLFMTVGYYGPHCPYVAPEALFAYYYRQMESLPPVTVEEEMHPAIEQWKRNRGVETISDEDVRRVKAAYFGMVEYLDGLIGAVLGKIEETVGFENTLIVYGSDHGDNIGEHGLFWKTNFYDGAARVPLIFSMPGKIPADSTMMTVASLLDLAPTFISIAEGPELPVMDGKSLWGLLTGAEPEDPERAITSQLADIKGDAPSAMVRKGRWKLVVHHGYDTPQLFDMIADPAELIDLGASPDHAHIRAMLKAILDQDWDPAAISRQLGVAKSHAEMLRKFTQVTELEGCDEWYGDQSGNYISMKTA